MDELVSVVTLKTLTFKLVLHFVHLLVNLPVKLISIICQTSLTPCIKYTVSSSLVPKRLMAANWEVLTNNALDVAMAMANLFRYMMPKSSRQCCMHR